MQDRQDLYESRSLYQKAYFMVPIDAQTALIEIARKGLSNVDESTVSAVAICVWHSYDRIDFAQIRGPYREEVLLLVDRLCGYTIVPKYRKKELQEAIRRECQALEMDSKSFQVAYRRVLPMLQSLQLVSPSDGRSTPTIKQMSAY